MRHTVRTDMKASQLYIYKVKEAEDVLKAPYVSAVYMYTCFKIYFLKGLKNA